MRENRRSETKTTGEEHRPSQASGRPPHTSPHGADERIERLFDDYAGRVYRYCLGRLGSPEEAEDALQATYLNAWRSLRGGVRPVSQRPWLFSIAANVCSTNLRSRLGGSAVELRDPEALNSIPDRADRRDELLGLSAALAQLPERQRHALLLRDWRGLSYDEIATQLDSSYEAVETLLFRARKSVAASLQQPAPARAAVRARAVAPLALLIPLRDAWGAVKAAVPGGIGPMKASIGIAVGAAAPLIAFGVLESGVRHSPSPAKDAAAPVIQIEAASSAPSPSTAGPAPAPALREKLGSKTTEAGGQPSASLPSAPPASGGGTPAVPADTSDPPAAAPDPPGSGNEQPQNPPPATGPPPNENEHPTLVTICHQTGSKKNPDVTITVASEAVDAHLALGDVLGACPG